MGRHIEAELEATKVINNQSEYELVNLEYVFLKNSKETIWALQPNLLSPRGTNTIDGADFLENVGGYRAIISSQLLSAFEDDDQRKIHWLITKDIGRQVFVPFKYKVGLGDQNQKSEEYTIVLRLAEQYLIRAESRVYLGNIEGAKEDLNSVRRRAGLPNTTANGVNQILSLVDHERQVELFSEWGDRWLNLKRTKMIDDVMKIVAPLKVVNGIGGTWLPYKALLPIPFDEFKKNPALVGHQNPGYSEN
jgi:hypothetical protein